jgi:hypothetical protein
MSRSATVAESTPYARKRTTSFSFHPQDTRPAKAPRMGSLRRSESMLLLPTPIHLGPAASPTNNHLNPHAPLPYYRTLSYYKEQRQRRKALNNNGSSTQLTIRTTPQPQQRQPSPPKSKPPASIASTKRPTPASRGAPSQIILPSPSAPKATIVTPRTSSPLSPVRTALPGRPVFPRSKAEPDLYRTAIKMRMLTTPEGQRILSLGPRLALEVMQTTQDIMKVTRDLEMMVNDIDTFGSGGGVGSGAAGDRDRDNDVVMGDCTSIPPTPVLSSSPLPPVAATSRAPPVLTTSWVVVKGDDWEMVDCAA